MRDKTCECHICKPSRMFQGKPCSSHRCFRGVGSIHGHYISALKLKAMLHLKEWVPMLGHTQLPINAIILACL